MKKLLLLPGTKWQLKLAETIKEKGYMLLVVDPAKDAPCKQIADECLDEDIFAIDKIYEFIDKKGIDGVISDQCDIAMPVVAQIAEKYKLNTIGSIMTRLYTNKYQMREFQRKNDLIYPRYKLCKNKEEAKDFFDSCNCKMIIKPIDSNASKGVYTIKTVEDIDRYFDLALQFSKVDNAVLMEEYIEGTEFTVDGIKTISNHFTMAISQKKHYAHNENIAKELFFSHYNAEYDYELLKETNDRFIKLSELPYGFTHAEYKFCDGKFYLIEIAARGGGNMISSVITNYMTGYTGYDYLIDCALGNVKDKSFVVGEDNKHKVAVLKFMDIPCESGYVKEIKGKNFLENNPNILSYTFNFKVGDKIERCISDSARIGFYIAGCQNESEYRKLEKEINEKVYVELEE